jgi:hypothetical protein
MHDGVQDKSILSETGNELRMILSPPGDCHLGLVNVLGSNGMMAFTLYSY